MATQMTVASLAILSFLLVDNTSAAKLNALCDPALHWTLTPSNTPYNFNPASCEVTLFSNSVNDNIQTAAIDVSSIFSNTANYPLNFTITADPYGSVKYGAVCSADGNNWIREWESSNDIRSITFTWSTHNTDSYYYKTNFFGGSSSVSRTMPYNLQPRDIVYCGFAVDESSISASSNENVKFVYFSLNGLTRSPTKYPTQPPTTATPTKQPTNIPTITPSQNPSRKPSIEPSISPSFNPSNYPSSYAPTNFPSLYPSISPTARPTAKPTTRPTATGFECNDTNLALVQISFNYQLQQENIGMNEIDTYLANITDDLVQQKNYSLNDCFISKYLTDIKTDINVKNAIITVSICTTCEKKEIENSILNDFEDVTQDTTIIAIIPDTTVIEVDVIIHDKDAEATASTTETILNTTKTKPNTGDDTTWIILAVLGSIVCICILFAAARILRLRQRDKQLPEGVAIGVMRVLTQSVDNNKQGNIIEGTVSMKTGHDEEEEDNTGSGEQYTKGTHSSLNVEDDEIIIGDDEHGVIGTPGKLVNGDEIVIDGEERDVGTPGNMLNDIIIADEDESPTNNDSGDPGTSDGISDGPNGNDNVLENTGNGDNKYQIDMSEHIEKIKDWLEKRVGFPEYLDNFVKNGYDRMDFIIEITDQSQLKEIGIDLMAHRTAIMAKIQILQNNANLIPHAAGFDLTLEGD